MSEQDRMEMERRRVLKLLGSGAVIIPLAGISACSGKESPPPAAEPSAAPAAAPEPESAAPEPAMAEPPASEAPAPSGELAPLTEDDPQAVALGYVEDAASVDAGKYPQYQAGQLCANCALYQGADAAEGGCSIFPGKAVKAAGWCSVYAPKA